MKKSITIIIFGITSDLAKRKLIPALYYLFIDKTVSSFVIIGTAFEHIEKQYFLNQAKLYIQDIDESCWHTFCNLIYYHQMDVMDDNSYISLDNKINMLEKQHNLLGNRLVYCAVASTFFSTITKSLAQHNIIKKKEKNDVSWHRIAYEKPFGHDTQSAQEIDSCIKEYFNEEQIYRVDHYLTKDLVSNISLIRFTNCVFEPLWNNKHIDQVHIMLNETVDVTDRGSYYDQFGAIKDVVQNHLLQMLALISMEQPDKLDCISIRDKRAQVLKEVKIVDGIRGQYEGYLNTKQVNKASDKETFALLLLHINNQRWSGVPFFLQTGKALNKKEVGIYIRFKEVDCLLQQHCDLVTSNWLNFTISPEEIFSLQLNIKKPGTSNIITQVPMNFCHSCLFNMRPSRAYEILIQEISKGELVGSVRSDEINYSWHITDDIIKKQLPLYSYIKNTSGPDEKKNFMQQYNMKEKI